MHIHTLRLLRTWALDARAQATALAELEPSWGSEVHEVADGWLVLSGRGLYVNRVMGAGIDRPLSNAHVADVRSHSERLGLDAAFEVSPATQPESIRTLERNGFAPDSQADMSAVFRQIPAPVVIARTDLVMKHVTSPDDLICWQEVAAAGWGHVEERARAASDAFARAAHLTDQDGMVIAVDRGSGEPRGCASVTIRDSLATLGGMSTLRDFRRTGVQTALVQHRLNFAADRGCDLATTTAETGGASERNLLRLGFEEAFKIETWTAS